MLITPNQFKVNEAWIIVRINDDFLFVQDEPYDIYVLVDASSAYMFGHVLSKVVDKAPPEKDVENLFDQAWSTKSQWAKKLIISNDSIANGVFKKQAEKNGLLIDIVEVSELTPIVGPLKEVFVKDFMGKKT